MSEEIKQRLQEIETRLIGIDEAILTTLAKVKELIGLLPQPAPDPDPPAPEPAPTHHPGYARPVIKQNTPTYWIGSLKDDGSNGTLRHALDLRNPLVIKSKVAGLVKLRKPLALRADGTKLDFSDMPFGIVDHRLDVRASHVTIGHMYGYGSEKMPGPDTAKIVNVIIGRNDKHSLTDILIHNCQLIGGIDATIDFWNSPAERGAKGPMIENVTLANNVIAWTLVDAFHSKGNHSRAMLVSKGVNRLSIYGNLFFGVQTRVPYLKDGAVIEYFSNVVALTQTGPQFGQKGCKTPMQANIYGNVFDRVGSEPVLMTPGTSNLSKEVDHRLWLLGNGVLASGEIAVPTDQRGLTSAEWRRGGKPLPDKFIAGSPHAWSGDDLVLLSGENTLHHVLAHAGPGWNDKHKRALVNHILSGTGHRIDKLSEIGGLPDFSE